MQNQVESLSLMPREKLLRFGAPALTDEELLAIFKNRDKRLLRYATFATRFTAFLFIKRINVSHTN
ncbi:DNA repair protein RadC [Pasteurella multocida subsp. gallicida str. Anand1_poultry]|nr:DNA repair protein RadC [Pasteurella multocida subsp. gallicida str. Anand1_poultry]